MQQDPTPNFRRSQPTHAIICRAGRLLMYLLNMTVCACQSLIVFSMAQLCWINMHYFHRHCPCSFSWIVIRPAAKSHSKKARPTTKSCPAPIYCASKGLAVWVHSIRHFLAGKEFHSRSREMLLASYSTPPHPQPYSCLRRIWLLFGVFRPSKWSPIAVSCQMWPESSPKFILMVRTSL